MIFIIEINDHILIIYLKFKKKLFLSKISKINVKHSHT